jgi:hypothetical protein
MQNFLEYLYKPFIETCFFLYNLSLLLFYWVTNKKITDKNRHKLDRFYYGNKTFNQSEISYKKSYLSKNFPWVLKFIWNCLILWGIYILIVSLGLVEIVKLFI